MAAPFSPNPANTPFLCCSLVRCFRGSSDDGGLSSVGLLEWDLLTRLLGDAGGNHSLPGGCAQGPLPRQLVCGFGV